MIGLPVVQQVNYRTRGRRFRENSSSNLRILLAPSKRKKLERQYFRKLEKSQLETCTRKGGLGGGVEGAAIPADDHAALELKDVEQPWYSVKNLSSLFLAGKQC